MLSLSLHSYHTISPSHVSSISVSSLHKRGGGGGAAPPAAADHRRQPPVWRGVVDGAAVATFPTNEETGFLYPSGPKYSSSLN